MPETVTLSAYTFDELEPEARARAIEWYRDGGFDHPWYDFVYEDFETVCQTLGVQLMTKATPLVAGGTRPQPRIFFRAFSRQGDGACFSKPIMPIGAAPPVRFGSTRQTILSCTALPMPF